MRKIEIIGEATRNIVRHYPDFVAQHPHVSWKAIYETRNRVLHGYFLIDLEVMWSIVQHDIPVLEPQILKLQRELKELRELKALQQTPQV